MFHSAARANYTAASTQQHQQLTADSMPASLRAIYEAECQAPPALGVFDEYLPEGQKALRLYTDPEFFIEQWIQEQIKLQQEAKKARKARRAQLKAQKKSKSDVKVVKKKPTKLERVRYDPVTGEKITTRMQASEKPAAAPARTSQPAFNVQQVDKVSNAFLSFFLSFLVL